MSLSRRTPLKPGKPLARTTRLESRTRLRQASPERELRNAEGKAGGLLRRSQPKHTAPRDTGFSQAVKLAVRTRAGNGDIDFARCECCNMWLGRYGGEVQHRVARKAGGRGPKAPWWANHIVNAALLCGQAALGTGDHGRAERREPDMGEDAGGWWIKDGPRANPALVPVLLHGDQGGIKVWLTTGGGYSTEAPEVAA